MNVLETLSGAMVAPWNAVVALAADVTLGTTSFARTTITLAEWLGLNVGGENEQVQIARLMAVMLELGIMVGLIYTVFDLVIFERFARRHFDEVHAHDHVRAPPPILRRTPVPQPAPAPALTIKTKTRVPKTTCTMSSFGMRGERVPGVNILVTSFGEAIAPDADAPTTVATLAKRVVERAQFVCDTVAALDLGPSAACQVVAKGKGTHDANESATPPLSLYIGKTTSKTMQARFEKHCEKTLESGEVMWMVSVAELTDADARAVGVKNGEELAFAVESRVCRDLTSAPAWRPDVELVNMNKGGAGGRTKRKADQTVLGVVYALVRVRYQTIKAPCAAPPKPPVTFGSSDSSSDDDDGDDTYASADDVVL